MKSGRDPVQDRGHWQILHDLFGDIPRQIFYHDQHEESQVCTLNQVLGYYVSFSIPAKMFF